MSYLRSALDSPHGDLLDKAFGHKNAFWHYSPGKLLMPIFFEDIAQDILDLKVKEDDVWLVSYPRTGSTWTQEIVWLLGNDLDYAKASKTIQQLRSPMIEMSIYFGEYSKHLTDTYKNSAELVKYWPSPRFIKTHLPYEFLPTEIDKVKPKIVYVARNPKDVCVSYYHHCKLLHDIQLTFEEFAELFLHDTVPLGSIFNHYLRYWERKDEPNILFLKYEDLKMDTKRGIRQIAEFMGKSLADEDVDKINEFLSVENMRKNDCCNFAPIISSLRGEDYLKKGGNTFIRKGKVGDWRSHMSEELSQRFDEWIRKNTEGTGLSFD